MKKPELKSTTNYNQFEIHEHNRPLHDTKMLLASMQVHGFMPSCAIHCRRMTNGKLKVVRGHHRLDCAKQLKLPVWYIVDDTEASIFSLEALPGQNWSVADFAKAYAHSGNKDCEMVLWFKKKHSLTIGAAACLLGGSTSLKTNHLKLIKSGTFRVGDMSHAKSVVAITDHCLACGIAFATSTAFVGAISMVVRLPDFDSSRFCHCVKMYGANLHKRGTVSEYLEEIEALYNYQAKKRLPVKFAAQEAARARMPSALQNNKAA